MLTLALLKTQVTYDPITGLFSRVGTQRNGPKAGRAKATYIRVSVFGVSYSAAHLAWFYTHGRWPADQMDHINRNRLDNRLCNLREATQAENLCNRNFKKVATSGYKGVEKCGKKWQARCNHRGRNHYLGVFHTPEEAHEAYVAFATKHKGVFAVTKYA